MTAFDRQQDDSHSQGEIPLENKIIWAGVAAALVGTAVLCRAGAAAKVESTVENLTAFDQKFGSTISSFFNHHPDESLAWMSGFSVEKIKPGKIGFQWVDPHPTSCTMTGYAKVFAEADRSVRLDIASDYPRQFALADLNGSLLRPQKGLQRLDISGGTSAMFEGRARTPTFFFREGETYKIDSNVEPPRFPLLYTDIVGNKQLADHSWSTPGQVPKYMRTT